MFLTHLGHPGQLSVSRDQGQTSPICGCWVRSIGRRAGPGVPRAVWISAPVKPGVSLHSCQLLQEGEGPPYRAPRAGSCLTLGKELSKETHMLTKQDILLRKGTQVKSSRVREPRRTALPCGSKSQVLWLWDLVSRWSLPNHSNSESFLVVQASLSQDGC